MPVSLHADQQGASRQAGQAILRAFETAQLTDVNVQAATTYASLRALITTTTGHADEQPLKSRIAQQMDIGRDDLSLTTTIITNATGAVNLASNTYADTTRRWGGPVQ